MNKMENKILNSIKKNKCNVDLNKFNGEKKINFVSFPSLTLVFLIPFIFVFLLNKFFSFNKDLFLFLLIVSFFCGAYNVYKVIHNILNKNNGDNDV